MSVTDMDQWTIPNSSPPTIATFGNPNTTIDVQAQSGAFTKMLDFYGSATGAHSFGWQVAVLNIPPNSHVVKIDTFTARDAATQYTQLNDGSRPPQMVNVFIQE